MKTLKLEIGNKVVLQSKDRRWKGTILESPNPEIILLKLESGYNIGIREREILDVEVLEKRSIGKKENNIVKKDKKLKNVAMIITGGTISSRLDPKTGAVISTDAEEILNIAPEIRNICNITKIEKPFMKFSEDMCPNDWKKLAEETHRLLNEKEIDGIIITHGTDTLHYTSSALSFFIKDLNKPIAITYSQRSIDRGSTDAHLNLICAARYAIGDIAEVAIIGHENQEDKYCLAMPGTKVRKMHTSRRDAFKVINSEPLARISKNKLEFLGSFNARNSLTPKLDSKYSKKVALIKVYPGQEPSIIDYYKKEGYKGLILEGTGLGHIPGKDSENNWISKVKKAIEEGMTICISAQTIFGRLNPNVYSTGRELQKTGAIFLEDILPETALVKLGWVLGHSSWIKEKEKIKEKMLESISREFSRTLKD